MTPMSHFLEASTWTRGFASPGEKKKYEQFSFSIIDLLNHSGTNNVCADRIA